MSAFTGNPNRLKYPLIDGESWEDRQRRLKLLTQRARYRLKNPNCQEYKRRRNPNSPVTKEYILSNVVSDPMTGCWNWTKGKSARGYGCVNDSGNKDYAHRCAYRLWVGPITEGKEVCHHCDNPSCCFHAHLFLGTHLENLMDCTLKGRRAKKLSKEQAIAIRNSTKSLSATAKDFGVSKKTILNIKKGRIFKWAA